MEIKFAHANFLGRFQSIEPQGGGFTAGMEDVAGSWAMPNWRIRYHQITCKKVQTSVDR